jgi:CMP-N-acetylneuraminic acid synthetase
MKRSLKALVPIKHASERIPGKNFRSFNSKPLYSHVLEKLSAIDAIDEIVIDTDSAVIKELCPKEFPKVRIIDRPGHILGHHVTMNTIIDYDLSQTSGEHFLQTHVTSPLFSGETVEKAIDAYFSKLDTFDSLFSVYKMKRRVYSRAGEPINCDLSKIERSQDMAEVLVENGCISIFSRKSFLAAGKSKFGTRPQFFCMSEYESADIDFEYDFVLAELMHRHQNLFPR